MVAAASDHGGDPGRDVRDYGLSGAGDADRDARRRLQRRRGRPAAPRDGRVG